MKKKKRRDRPQGEQPGSAAAAAVVEDVDLEEELEEELDEDSESVDDSAESEDEVTEDAEDVSDSEAADSAEDQADTQESEPEVDAADLLEQFEAELLSAAPDEAPPQPDIVAAHLRAIQERGLVTVDEFRRYLELPGWGAEQARMWLSQFVDQGLVSRAWSEHKGRYSLTEAGKLRAA